MELDFEYLDFMISAPSQGVVAIASRVDDLGSQRDFDNKLIIKETQICVVIERNFPQNFRRWLYCANWSNC